MIISNLEIGDVVLVKGRFRDISICRWVRPMDQSIGKELTVVGFYNNENRLVRLSDGWHYINDDNHLEYIHKTLQSMSKSNYLSFDKMAIRLEAKHG